MKGKNVFSAYRDPRTGLTGLMSESGKMIPARFRRVVALDGPFAIVEDIDGEASVIHTDGFVQTLRNARDITLLPGYIIKLTIGRKHLYKDAYSVATFTSAPRPVRFGRVEMLAAEDYYAPRTRLNFRFRTPRPLTGSLWNGYCLEVPYIDGELRAMSRRGGIMTTCRRISGNLVLLPGDHENIYRRVGENHEGLLISDQEGRRYCLTRDGSMCGISDV